MKALLRPWLVACLSLCVAVAAGAQTPVGALAIDERRGDQYGWAVDYETPAAARAAALRECCAGCSVVLTFARCGAYAADQDADSTAVGWAESFDSSAGAQQAALAECSSRGGGSGCTVRVWGCNGPGGRGGAGSEPGRAATDSAGPSGGGLRSWRRGRSVRSADAGGDSELAIRARRTVDRVPGRPAGRGLAQPGRIRASSRGCRCFGFRGTGTCVLAVDPEQHEPGGVRGVSGAVPERRVPGAGAAPSGGAAWCGERCNHGSPAGRQRACIAGFGRAGLRSGVRARGACRFAAATERGVPPRSDVYQPAKCIMLDGNFPAARLLRLEPVPADG